MSNLILPAYVFYVAQFVKQFLEKGNRVVATARDLSKASHLTNLKEQHAGLELTELDVTNEQSRKVSFKSACFDHLH
jgi:NADP-dependent 3-hydroxy acid dehydrogenase YdfG